MGSYYAAIHGSTMIPLLLLAVAVRAEPPGCSVRQDDLAERAPLMLRPGSRLDRSSFVAPDADLVLRLQANASLLLACPGAKNQLVFANNATGLRQVNATCLSGAQVSVRGRGAVDLRRAACALHAERSAEREWLRRCGAGGRGQRVRVGFRLLTGFLQLVSVCFDDALLSPIFTNYTLVRNNGDEPPPTELKSFRRERGIWGDVVPERQYLQQHSTLNYLLGYTVPLMRDSIIPGYLTPGVGPIFPYQKNVTYLYVNAAPLWNSSAGAWALVERAARTLAAARGDLQVLTGVFGVAALPDARGFTTDLFLFSFFNNTRKMPLPVIFWKVVYDPRTQEGAAMVVNNHPWAPLSRHPEKHLCTDVCTRLRWLPAHLEDMYCCEVGELRRHLGDLPPLDVRGLLEDAAPKPGAPPNAAPKAEAPSNGGSNAESLATQPPPAKPRLRPASPHPLAPRPAAPPPAPTPRSEPKPRSGGSVSVVIIVCVVCVFFFVILCRVAYAFLKKRRILAI